MSPRRSLNVGHAARVAAITTILIAAVYVLAVGVLDLVLTRRLTAQVDARLANVLVPYPHASAASVISRARRQQRGQDPDDVPVLLWQVDQQGRVTSLTVGAPALPRQAWSPGGPATASLGSSNFRLESRPIGGGAWLVAGESLADSHRLRSDLLIFAAVVGPVMLLAIYLGAWAIGVSASAPVERTRRRQLEFAADASHELRTPLSVIEAEVGLALSASRPASYYRSSLERVSGESRRLRRIVEDLLWLARFDSEPPPPGEEPVDVAVIAAACSERFGPVAAGRQITLSVDVVSEPPALIKAPPEWVDRLAGVLVDNACRYTPRGGTVRVVVAARGGRVSLIVDDSGPGIPPAERDHLFDRFRRATDQPGGAGLGLAIADAVVRSTGGRWTIGASDLGGARMEVSWHRTAASDRPPLRRSRDRGLGDDARGMPSADEPVTTPDRRGVGPVMST